MGNARKPLSVAEVTGQTIKNPQRYSSRARHASPLLGEPTPGLTEGERTSWANFKRELPWLTEGDRALVELACRLRARMDSDPDIAVSAMTQLRLCLQTLGATPTDRCRVPEPDGSGDDPAEQYFN
ncbi:hypothetical protein FKB34_11355 [Glycocaulis profundi]|nr:hypothetical protein FKB34_11355 [Glycocaulis profundi]